MAGAVVDMGMVVSGGGVGRERYSMRSQVLYRRMRVVSSSRTLKRLIRPPVLLHRTIMAERSEKWWLSGAESAFGASVAESGCWLVSAAVCWAASAGLSAGVKMGVSVCG